MPEDIDLRLALNAVSDVIQNRPRPLREFDQIHMKAGDMVLQSEFIARWADGKRLAFIGDGDAISVCIAYMKERRIFDYGPSRVTVFDFDERVCKAVERFADQERIETLDAELYNCLDPFPACGKYDAFYTNPPWGASNEGRSAIVFTQRGLEAIGYAGEGAVVVADDHTLEWPGQVLAALQRSAVDAGFYVQKMMSKAHSYHLDDAPDLRSCNLLLRSVGSDKVALSSAPITDSKRLEHFYGRDQTPKVRYVRERERLQYGTANEHEYLLELLADPQ